MCGSGGGGGEPPPRPQAPTPPKAPSPAKDRASIAENPLAIGKFRAGLTGADAVTFSDTQERTVRGRGLTIK
tara:strand:+ start:100 stop:315 length:216 start_codon:yes stop_codon:yes gene_type:complete